MKLHSKDILLLEIDDEPIEYCNEDSCMFGAYKSFKNKIVKEIYNSMIDNYDKVFRIDTKKNKLDINIKWYSNNFDDDLWEYDINKIKHTIFDSFITSGTINRKDKLFSNNYLDIINIDKIFTSGGDFDIINDRFIIEVIFEL